MKAERAKGHLDAFNFIVADYLPKATTVTTRDDFDASRCIRRTEFHAFPPELGMELGEFVYCLRSGLDQLAWHVATVTARKDSPKDVCFPIVKSLINSDQRKKYKRSLALFPTNIAAEIDALQPYKEPSLSDAHPLWQLNTLCNLDKHCVIPINSRTKRVFVVHGAVVTYPHDVDAVDVSIPLADKSKFEFDPNLPGDIELGEWDADLTIPRRRLADIHDFVINTVIPAFERFDIPVVHGERFRTGDSQPVYG